MSATKLIPYPWQPLVTEEPHFFIDHIYRCFNLFYFILATRSVLSMPSTRRAKICSLSLSHLISLKLICMQRQECLWKSVPMGFLPLVFTELWKRIVALSIDLSRDAIWSKPSWTPMLFLGIEVAQSKDGLAISQRKYTINILQEKMMINVKSL